MRSLASATSLSMALALPAAGAAAGDDIHCDTCAQWNAAQAPFKVYGNTWYVGTAGLSALLVTGPRGHILLDGALPQSAPQIIANIRALGFRIEDVRIILNSHPHWDHAGGIAALQRASGAKVMASAASAEVLERGAIGADDPQYEAGAVTPFPKVARVGVIADGQLVKLGPLALSAHMTPGHTPGGTSWSWRSCEQGTCRDMVYADSLTAVSADGFRFSGDATHPDLSGVFKASIARIAALPCDVVVSAHPSFTGIFEKLAARAGDRNAFIAPGGCRAYAEQAGVNLEQRLARERDGK
ncbi:MAG: subclass B3 metallo-beta-lactamase [Massilia sp.]